MNRSRALLNALLAILAFRGVAGWQYRASGVRFERKLVASSVTVRELKALLREKGLPVSGCKAELLRRLETAHQINGPESPGRESTPIPVDQHVSRIEDAAEPKVFSGQPREHAAAAAAASRIYKLIELMETVLERQEADPSSTGTTLPRAVVEARDDLLDAAAYATALERRRAAVRERFGEFGGGGGASEAALRRVEMAHAFLSGVATHERAKVCRADLNEILGTAVAGGGSGGAPHGTAALDACLQRIAAAGRLDDRLVEYATSLVEGEARKCGMPPPPVAPHLEAAAAAEESAQDRSRQHSDAMPSGTVSARSPLLSILVAVRSRIVVERQAMGQEAYTTVSRAAGSATGAPDPAAAAGAASSTAAGTASTLPLVKLLAQLVAIDADDARATRLASVLSAEGRAFARDFVRFAEDGAQYLTDQVEKATRAAMVQTPGSGGDSGGGGDDDARPVPESFDAELAAKIRQAGRVRATALQAREVLRAMAGQ